MADPNRKFSIARFSRRLNNEMHIALLAGGRGWHVLDLERALTAAPRDPVSKRRMVEPSSSAFSPRVSSRSSRSFACEVTELWSNTSVASVAAANAAGVALGRKKAIAALVEAPPKGAWTLARL